MVTMKLTFRHLAACQYTVIAVSKIGIWYALCMPPAYAPGQIAYLFTVDLAHRPYFIWLVLDTVLTVTIALLFWFKRATSPSFFLWLAWASAGLLVGAVWFAGIVDIVSHAFACALTGYVWWQGKKA